VPGKIREIASGLGFIEGPVYLEPGQLLFTDINARSVKCLDLGSGDVEEFAYTAGGPNGLARGPDGAFYLCNNGGLSCTRSSEGYNIPIAGTPGDDPIPPCIQRITPDGKVEVIYLECDGEPLAAPNDLVFDRDGGFYFTDTGHNTGRLADLGGLYYAKWDGSSIVELIREPAPHAPLSQPNGCGLSPDGKRIYVAETGGGRLWYWTIESPGKLGAAPDSVAENGAHFLYGCPDYHLFDSLAVDGLGNVCVATILKGGINVIAPDGKLDRFVQLPQYDPFPTNICFGGSQGHLAYVTAAGTGKIYEIEWHCAGMPLNY
jgi:gluconolactonase